MKKLVMFLILGLVVAAFGHPYITNPGTLLDGFENVADWTVSGTGASAENDPTLKQEGNQSIKLNTATGGNAFLTKSGLSLDLSDADSLSFWIYINDVTKLDSISYYVSSQTNFSKYFQKWMGSSNLVNGWNYLVWSKSEYINEGTESWNNTMVAMRVKAASLSGQSVSVNFDDLRTGVKGRTKVILTFDDGHINQINKAYPIMANNDQRGIMFIVVTSVGISNYMTLANLQTLKSAGWDISNHTYNHTDLTTDTQVEMEADIDGGYDWLVANGFGESSKFFAYPYGHWNDVVVVKVKENHILARRVGGIAYGHFNILNFHDLQFKLTGYEVQSTTSVATIEALIDKAIERGGLTTLLFHNIVDSGATGNQYLTADFNDISDYLKTKQDAGLLEVITFSDYYNALNTPFLGRK